MKRTIGTALAALALAALPSCGNDAPAGATDSGAEQAREALSSTVATLVEAAVPGADISGFTTEELTCTDSAAPDRIMFRMNGSGLTSKDTGKSFQRLQRSIKDLDMTADLDRNIPAQEIGFRGDSIRGNVIVRTTGSVSISATTDCYDS